MQCCAVGTAVPGHLLLLSCLGLWRTTVLLEQETPLAFIWSPCRNHCDTFNLHFSCSNDLKPKLHREGREVLSCATYQYQGCHLPRINLLVWRPSSLRHWKWQIWTNKQIFFFSISESSIIKFNKPLYSYFYHFGMRPMVMLLILDF